MLKRYNERHRTRHTWIFMVVMILFFLMSQSAWKKAPIVEEALFMFACLLAATGALGRAWCAVFISGRKDGVLVRQGPYALCRNPLYFFSFLGGLGVALATETMTFPILFVLLFTLYYPFVIRSEERRLSSLFGKDYDTYRKEVPCFFPRFSLLTGNEPDDYPVCSRTLRHALFDTLWFIWALGFIEFAEALHETKILPALFCLY